MLRLEFPAGIMVMLFVSSASFSDNMQSKVEFGGPNHSRKSIGSLNALVATICHKPLAGIDSGARLSSAFNHYFTSFSHTKGCIPLSIFKLIIISHPNSERLYCASFYNEHLKPQR